MHRIISAPALFVEFSAFRVRKEQKDHWIKIGNIWKKKIKE